MPRLTLVRSIDAPVERVFRTVADVTQFSQAIPHIVRVEFLSNVRSGIGARFRETRMTKGMEASTELEVTEYVENDRVRIVSEAGGAVWDTAFTVSSAAGRTELTMAMDARALKWPAKITLPVVMRMIRKAVISDMDDVKAFCERPAQEAPLHPG